MGFAQRGNGNGVDVDVDANRVCEMKRCADINNHMNPMAIERLTASYKPSRVSRSGCDRDDIGICKRLIHSHGPTVHHREHDVITYIHFTNECTEINPRKK